MELGDIRRVLVVGAGTMGPGIAQVYATAGYAVDLVDTQTAALDRAREGIRLSLGRLAEWGAVPAGDVPAILVTGSTMTGHEAESQAHDFHVLTKPVVPNKLRAMIAFKLGVR